MKLAFPKASWVPYNPFWSREIPYSEYSKPFLHKTMFSGTLDLLKTSPRPTREPDFGFQSKFRIRGLDFGSQDRKTKRRALKFHAEPRLQNSKWSHMVQVIAQHHFGRFVPKTLLQQVDMGANSAQWEQGAYGKSVFFRKHR